MYAFTSRLPLPIRHPLLDTSTDTPLVSFGPGSETSTQTSREDFHRLPIEGEGPSGVNGPFDASARFIQTNLSLLHLPPFARIVPRYPARELRTQARRSHPVFPRGFTRFPHRRRKTYWGRMTDWLFRRDSVEPEGSSSSRRVQNARVKDRDPYPVSRVSRHTGFLLQPTTSVRLLVRSCQAGSNTAVERCDRHATCTPREGSTPYSDTSFVTKGKPFVVRVASSAKDLPDLLAHFKGPNDRSR